MREQASPAAAVVDPWTGWCGCYFHHVHDPIVPASLVVAAFATTTTHAARMVSARWLLLLRIVIFAHGGSPRISGISHKRDSLRRRRERAVSKAGGGFVLLDHDCDGVEIRVD